MHAILAALVKDVPFTGDIPRDVMGFLHHHDCPGTAVHSTAVAAEARRIAAQVGVDEALAARAAWLHDVSAVFPADERLAAAKALGVDVLPEERALPMILHQKLAALMAREVFGVTDVAVLSAIGCHTTLKADASRLDKIVFVADKLAWDQPGDPPYRAAMVAALAESLDAAACVYLRYLWERRATLRVVHPWFVAALANCELRIMNPSLQGEKCV